MSLDQRPDIIIIAGGDGTVRKVATHLPERRIPIAILPLGTANNVARSLGSMGDPLDLIEGWKSGRRQRLDIGLAAGPWGETPFMEAVGCGALAATADKHKYAQGEGVSHGREAFRDALEKAEPIKATIRFDGDTRSGRWIAIEVLNHRYTGPGLMLAPDADPGDGMLNLFCVAEEQRGDVLEWLLETPGEAPPLAAIRTREVSFEWDGSQPLRIDDKVQETRANGSHEVTVRLQEEPLTLLLPRKADDPRDEEGSKAAVDHEG